ncbi:MAG TPA: 4-hydroxy-tetrahydrodipicolinate reductase [Clostridia bacterium]|nr:4-hydroxy-tetrahydrodipicolinate reductase [Clostridia bacterium]
MKIVLVGYSRMGRLIESLAANAGHTVVSSVDEKNAKRLFTLGRNADIVMDFSAPAALPFLADCIRRTGMPLLSGTTGYTAADMDAFRTLGAYAPVLHSANYSIGIAVFRRMLETFSPTLLHSFDAEITEIHHNKKADAPSGTAKLLYEAIDPDHAYMPVCGREGAISPRGQKEIGIHALRGGTVAGTHTVSFFGQDEELSITHRASSRTVFASGALAAAEILVKNEKGFYTLDQILFGGTL